MHYNVDNILSTARSTVQEWLAKDKEARSKLYEALAQAFSILREAHNDSVTLDALRQKAKDEKLPITPKTKAAHLVIRLVFKDVSDFDVSTYAKTIEVARTQGVSREHFPQWLRDNGGVNAVRRWSTASSNNKKGNTGQGQHRQGLETRIQKLSKDGWKATLNKQVVDRQEGETLLLVAKVDSDGRLRVSSFVDKIDDPLAKLLSERLTDEVKLRDIQDAQASEAAPTTPTPVDDPVADVKENMKKAA